MSLAVIVLAAAVAAATSAHLPVSTNDARAQAAVDRGLFLYYAYAGDAAAQSFARAATLDGRLAMAYWGIALASGPDLNTPMTSERFARGSHAMEQALALVHGATPNERRFIAAMDRRYLGTFANWQRNDASYDEAMLQFARESHDENARLLAAEALLEGGGLAWEGGALANESSREALQLMDDVLRDDPASAMANHLCIHLYDLAPDRAPAFPCAQRLDGAAFPADAEHLAHMPAHYWIETGNYAAAVSSSDRAYQLVASEGATATSQRPSHYARHDVAVGYAASMMLGNYAVAQLWAQRMTSALEQNFHALTALRFGRYADADAAGGSQFGGPSVRGLAALQLGRAGEAHAIAAHVSPSNDTPGYLPQLFLARLAEADGRSGEARKWIERALHNQRADFSGELIPLLPAGEALGTFYLRHGDGTLAAAAFSDTLAAYPNDPRALFGLMSALSVRGERAQATAARARFEMEWKGTDTDIRDALP